MVKRGWMDRTVVVAAGLTGLVAAGLIAMAAPAPLVAAGLPMETPVEEMPPQMARAHVIGIQEELLAHGYRPGRIDGELGSATRNAIRAYQRDAGLAVNGVASKELLEHLKFAQPKVYARKVASSGPSRELVSEVQRLLGERGYYDGEVDGRLGPLTRAAVHRFQADAGLPVTGVVDQRLQGELGSASAEIRAGSSQ
jgi:peptidoglycan hydrolase-like protein with peptidoglycan-binding domain